MRNSKAWMLVLLLACSSFAIAQALAPEEIQQPGPHRLQQKYFGELRAIASEMDAHQFPYHFYFSRAMDISEKDQLKLDQRSLRFDRFQDYTVLAVSGNYFAAYSNELVDKNERAKRTLNDVVLPILRAEVPRFVNDDTFDGFAFEISHHVRRDLIGVPAENAENVVYYFPRAAAQHLSQAKTPDEMQSALLDSKVFVDAEPFNLWVNGERPADEPETPIATRLIADDRRPIAASEPVQPTVSQKFIKPTIPVRLITPAVLESLKTEYADTIASLQRDLRDQAHFAGYAPIQFVGFHEGAYLELPLIYEIKAPAEVSRYSASALTFDDHVSHLIRATLAHFHDSGDFDGVVFSVVVKPEKAETSVAVEYFLPLQAMRSYANYDCTGQELLDSGFVLINGERATLNLQTAESHDRFIANR